MKLPVLTAIGLAALVTAKPFDYHGYKVFQLDAGHTNETRFLEEYLGGFNYEIYDIDGLRGLSLAIAPDNITAFEGLGLKTRVLHDDMGVDMDAELGTGSDDGSGIGSEFQALSVKYQSTMKLHPCLDQREAWFKEWFDSYHPFHQHVEFWDTLSSCFTKHSKVEKFAETYNGRGMFALILYGQQKEENPGSSIWIQANVYGREWIATAAAEYIAFALVNDYLNGDREAISLLRRFQFYFIPVVNPDGMAETQSKNRNWEKNKMRWYNHNCDGINLNRNWPVNWPVGDANLPCVPDFKGNNPGEAIEVKSLMDLMKDKNVMLGIDYQARGQRVMWPFHSRAASFKFATEYDAAAQKLVDYLNGLCTGKCKTWAGALASAISYTSGTALDYMAMQTTPSLEHKNRKFVVQVGRREGGFIIPKEEILPIVEEQYKAMKWYMLNVI